jgi:hypothetical protein
MVAAPQQTEWPNCARPYAMPSRGGNPPIGRTPSAVVASPTVRFSALAMFGSGKRLRHDRPRAACSGRVCSRESSASAGCVTWRINLLVLLLVSPVFDL